jgi:violaxanthin de-epoxidase
MMKPLFSATIFTLLLQFPQTNAFVVPPTRITPAQSCSTISLSAQKHKHQASKVESLLQSFQRATAATLLAVSLVATTQLPLPAHATDSGAIVSCLFQKCALPLGKCILNPNCLANVICINTCNNRPDETECQIQCGNLFENDVVGEFNKCAVSDMSCVPKKEDDGSYPIPPSSTLVSKFDTSLFNGKWYITAGQNPLFDTFPCQVHFFTEPSPGTFFGKLNWRVEEPDGEFFTRDALQRFVQDPKEPAHLLNHDNEYLHYQDDWYIVDYAQDDNKDGVPPFCFVYYRGSNDAWDGYGGAVVYTRAAKLPPELIPRLRVAAQKVNFDWDKDFVETDNSCPTQTAGDQLLLREKFAGKVALSSEEQLQAASTRLRGNVVNSVKAQVLYVNKEFEQAQKAFEQLSADALKFEQERASISGGDVKK